MIQFILLKGLHFVKAINAIIALSLKNQNRPLKATGGERDVCPGSSVSSAANFKLQLHFTAAKFPVAAAESPPMTDNRSDGHRLAVNACTNHRTVCELSQLYLLPSTLRHNPLLLFQPQSITVFWPIPNYTAWHQGLECD